MIGGLKANKNKIVKIIAGVAVITSISIIGGTAYLNNVANANTNYSEEEAKEIALSEYEGEVVSVKKDKELDFDDSKTEYEITIKDSDNRLVEVIVDGKYGTIINVDGKTSDIYKNNADDTNLTQSNYTEEQIRGIALEEYPGTILELKKDVDSDDNEVDYDIKIETNDNKIVELTVDGITGKVYDVDIEVSNTSELQVNHTEEQAREIALAEYPGTILELEKDVDSDDNKMNYDIKIETNDNKIVELTVDGITGNISDIDIENNNVSEVKVNYTEEQAKEIALAEYEGTVIEVWKDIDSDDNKIEYEIKIQTNDNKIVEVTVDATSGVIVDIDN